MFASRRLCAMAVYLARRSSLVILGLSSPFLRFRRWADCVVGDDALFFLPSVIAGGGGGAVADELRLLSSIV